MVPKSTLHYLRHMEISVILFDLSNTYCLLSHIIIVYKFFNTVIMTVVHQFYSMMLINWFLIPYAC